MKHLMIFSIGPVQDFIATARRSRDLWYGSWMLSELSKAAVNKISELSPPEDLIFPYTSSADALKPASNFNAPNKIMALIDGDPKIVGKEIKAATKKRLGELWEDARSYVKGSIDDSLAKSQIDDLLEFYWVSVPYEDNYKTARDKAEEMFAARKVTRNFNQAVGSSSPKSSLDGSRESVIPKGEYPERKDAEDLKKTKINNLYKHYHARRGEQLSGVDLLKRLGDPENSPKFKSTSDIAAIPFIQMLDNRLGEGQGRKFVESIKSMLPTDSDKLDGAEEGLAFEGRFIDCFPSQQISDTQLKEFNDLFMKTVGDFRPNPYYALIRADGDNMGVVIDEQPDLKTHQSLSRALSDFAAQVKGFIKVKEGDGGLFDGVLIYSGGDDVLAYLPLHMALGFAKKIEESFKIAMGSFKTQDGILPTLSVGIAVSHHLEPLSDALELAHEAEKAAKSISGKNGLAIIVSKRSGTERLVKDKFSKLEERLRKLIQFSEADAISAGTAYELQKLHSTLSDTNIPGVGLAREAMRIVARKREAGSDRDINTQIKETFEGWLSPQDNNQAVSLDELALEMIVAKMFTFDSKKEAQ